MDKISRKIDKKVAKLTGRDEGRAGMFGVAMQAASDAHQHNMTALRGSSFQGRRKLLIALMLVGMAIALGVIAGNSKTAEYGVAAAMTTVFMYLGLSMIRPVTAWFGAGRDPQWAPHLVALCCCAPLVAMGATPVLADSPRNGLPFFLGLLALCVLGNWDKERDQGETGELSFGMAFWAGLSAVIWTNIAAGVTDSHAGNVMFIAGGVAGVCSLVTQASSSWRQGAGTVPHVPSDIPAMHPGVQSIPPGFQPVSPDDTMQQLSPRHFPTSAQTTAAPLPVDPNAPIERSAITRMFFGLVSFALMAGMIVTLLVPFILNEMTYEDTTGTIIGCIACGAALTFALRKTAPLRKRGIARNLIYPALVTLGLFGAGAITTGIIRHWGEYVDESRVISIVGLCASAVFLFVGFFPPRLGRVVARPFLVGGEKSPSAQGAVAVAHSEPALAEAGRVE